jgi:signal transduction histidine kinase
VTRTVSPQRRSPTTRAALTDSQSDQPGAPTAIPYLPSVGRKHPPSIKTDRTPWASSGFWVLQLVVLALYLTRLAATVAFHLDATSETVELSTLAIFLVPVIYATLNYGLEGALITAGWVTVLAVPRFLSAVSDHNYVSAWVELAQILLLDALAGLVGQRVTAERVARRAAESAQQAHLSAEALYRELFESNQAPILIVDGRGNVVESNPSAQRAFGAGVSETVALSNTPRSTDGSERLVDMIGPIASGQILSRLIAEQLPRDALDRDDVSDSASERVEPVAFDVGGQPHLYRPTATVLSHSEGGTRMQIVFEDVTAETRRRDLMEAYAARVVSGQEEERRHIAQELHDGPVQTLIHLCRQIDAMDGHLHLAEAGSVALIDLRSIVEDTVAELRSIATGLRPSILDDLGLVASINQVLAEAGRRHEFETSFGTTGTERRLAPPIELALFRIAQEAISNVERHAAAHRVAVGLSFEECGLRLLVTDDGVGFDAVRHPNNRESLGLPGMTERAHLIGSRIVVHSAPGKGTTVDVWVPTTILDQIPPTA